MVSNLSLQRMIWKEYRSLRTLWLGCLLGTFGVLALTKLLEPYLGFEFRYASSQFALWVPVLYLVGCTGASFAGEEEERTAGVLIHLSPPLRIFWGGKTLAMLGSAIALQILMFLTAALFVSTNTRSAIPELEWSEMLLLVGLILLEAMAWGQFCSLQLKHALPAVLLAIVFYLFSQTFQIILIAIFFDKSASDFLVSWPLGTLIPEMIALRMGLILSLIGVNLVLAQQWLQGQAMNWGSIVKAWPRSSFPIAVRQLQIAAEPAEPWQRAWLRLRWLEWQGLRSFFYLGLAISVVLLIASGLSPIQSMAMFFLFCWLFPLVLGVMAWRGEQVNSQFRHLLFRGIPASAVWSNKLICWCLTPLLLLVGLLAIAAILGQASPGSRPYSWEIAFNYPMLNWQTAFYSHAIVIWLTAFCLSFATGFLTGHFFRRTVVAFGAGLLSVVVLMLWQQLSLRLGLPFLLFIWPLPILLLAVSWRHLENWQMEREGWRVWLPRVSELAALTGALLFGFIVWRIVEIPNPSREVNQLLVMARGQNSTTTNYEGIRTSADWFYRAGTAQWQAVATKAEAWDRQGFSNRFVELRQIQQTPTEQDQKLQELMYQGLDQHWPQLVELRDNVLKAVVLDTTSEVVGEISSARHVLFCCAVRAMDRRRPNESALWLQAGFRLLGASTISRQSTSWGEYDVAPWYGPLMQWAMHPQQTEPLLRNTLAKIVDNESRWFEGSDRALFSYQSQIRALETDSANWLGLANWEVARQKRILGIALIHQYDYARSGTVNAAYPRRIQYENLRLPPNRGDQPIGMSPGIAEWLRAPQTWFRGSILAAMVTGYRQIHGELPESLGPTVRQYFANTSQSLSDPWAVTDLFRYEQVALPNTVLVDGSATVDAGPFLWSIGPSLHLEWIGREVRLRQSPPPFSPSASERNYTQLNPKIHYLFPIPPETAKQQETAAKTP